MCGINGIIQKDELFSQDALAGIIHKMNDKIIHRGPDSEGVYVGRNCAFGMRRLSVIDLNNGNQPIWNETHDLMIIFNGELYNYKSLKKQLVESGHKFSTESDTEVVLHGYETYGTEFVKKMEGMFAFAIYDTVQERCFIARDRSGEKPLYYYISDSVFLFGSELKSLISTNIVPLEIDRDALACYFYLTYIPAPKSIIKNVHKLMPASCLTIDREGHITEECYWMMDEEIRGEVCQNYDECKKLLRERLVSSVEKMMVSDVPLGAFLSGGFDSTIIVGIMSRLSKEAINTFTIGFKEKQYDESRLARLVAEKNHTNHNMLILDWNVAAGDLEYILNNIDEPFADPSLIATYEVSKLAKQFVTVTLTGDAGDELFAGYDKYLISYYGALYDKVPEFVRKGIVEPIVEILPKNSNIYRKAKKVVLAAGGGYVRPEKAAYESGV